ncbi:MAG: DUF2332 domain-containing protein [Actinobacteria bacterium]|nr:DUF2332 domain-containing protein [Actinomycetota bacterium]
MSRPRSEETVAEVFRRMAKDSFERGGSPLYARLAREHADDPVLTEIGEGHEPRWEVPLRLFGGLHLLALTGEEPDPWSRLPEVLRDRREWLAEFVATQPVQTNEVQRCWALLPAFLTVADGRPLALVELGPSAGLNLLWDRYGYRYPGASWGFADAGLVLEGEATEAPEPRLFDTEVTIGARLGIDQAPIDLTEERQALLLQCFVWADQTERLERLRGAIEIARRDPPRLVAGDYVERLPALLAKRRPEALTLVFNSATTGYLPRADRARLEDSIAEAGREGGLARVSYEFLDDGDEPVADFEAFRLEVETWPGGRRLVARTDGHGNRMRWVA